MNTKPQVKPAPLGRGLSALFGDTDSSYQPKPVSVGGGSARREDVMAAPSSPTARGVPTKLPIAWIQPGAFQPRRHFDETAIQELADSIRERGVLQPLMVRPLEGEKDAYEIIAGERRWRASQLVGLHEVPVLIRHFTDREAMEIGLIENVQRKDLSPIEEAEGYRRLIEEFSHTQENLSKIVGKSRPHITNLLRLLKLPEPVRRMLNNGDLSMAHARAIITADDPESLAKEIVKKGLTARQAELLAKKHSDGRFAKKERIRKDVDPNILALEKEIGNAIGLKVKIQNGEHGGTFTVFYSDLDQLDLVLRKLQA